MLVFQKISVVCPRLLLLNRLTSGRSVACYIAEMKKRIVSIALPLLAVDAIMIIMWPTGQDK